MSERKVINKYYPPDFDPSKLPKIRRPATRTFNIRTMAPCNMRCNKCGDYIYKGRKFNSRCQEVPGDHFLGLKVYKFTIKCPRCVSEISFRSDPESEDYELENGATRNFESVRTAERMERERERKQREAEEMDPMLALEKRTKQSAAEMDAADALDDLRALRDRQGQIDARDMLTSLANEEQPSGDTSAGASGASALSTEEWLHRQEEEDEQLVRSVFGKRPAAPAADEEPEEPSSAKRVRPNDSASATSSSASSSSPALTLSAPPKRTATGPLSFASDESAAPDASLSTSSRPATKRSEGSEVEPTLTISSASSAIKSSVVEASTSKSSSSSTCTTAPISNTAATTASARPATAASVISGVAAAARATPAAGARPSGLLGRDALRGLVRPKSTTIQKPSQNN